MRTWPSISPFKKEKKRKNCNFSKVQVVLTAPQVITCLHYLLISGKSARTAIGDKYEIMQRKQNNAQNKGK